MKHGDMAAEFLILPITRAIIREEGADQWRARRTKAALLLAAGTGAHSRHVDSIASGRRPLTTLP